MNFEDKPRPGGGYLLFLHGVLGGSLLLDIAVTWHIGGSEPVALIARQEKVFLSPSNPDIFMEQIRSRLTEPEIELSPPCRSGQ